MVCSFPTVVASSPVSVSNTVDGNEDVVTESSCVVFVDVLDDIVVDVSASVKLISGFVSKIQLRGVGRCSTPFIGFRNCFGLLLALS